MQVGREENKHVRQQSRQQRWSALRGKTACALARPELHSQCARARARALWPKAAAVPYLPCCTDAERARFAQCSAHGSATA